MWPDHRTTHCPLLLEKSYGIRFFYLRKYTFGNADEQAVILQADSRIPAMLHHDHSTHCGSPLHRCPTAALKNEIRPFSTRLHCRYLLHWVLNPLFQLQKEQVCSAKGNENAVLRH